MDAGKSHFMNVMLASLVIVLFLIAATVTTVTWSPTLPEAIIVDITRNKLAASDEFSTYIALHQSQSWHYTAGFYYPVLNTDCLQ